MKPQKPKSKSKNNFMSKIKKFFTIPEEVFEEEPSPQFERHKLFTLTRTNIFIGLFLFLLIINTLIIFDVNFIYLRQILGFLFLITVPGIVLMLCFKIRNIDFWEYLVYTVGLSISFIMFAGLIVNWTLPWLNITDKPLSLFPILICFNIFLIILGIIAYKINKDFKPRDFTLPKFDTLNNIFFTIPMFFPVLSILGAFLLNNHGPNILTIFRKRWDKNIWPWAIWMIGLSILLSWWLRSWYVSGVDSNLEFLVFQLTKNNSFWSINNYRNAYNAMLSLTILPTILSNLSNTENHFVFKLLFQFLFSLVPLIIFFIIQPYFIAIQIRQAIAFVFFSLLFLIYLEKDLSLPTHKLFFVIFGISMIVSHYSTSYIALVLLVIINSINYISEKWKK